MPNIHPTSLDHLNDIQNSERKVHKKLSTLDDTFHVFHSVTWSYPLEGECDFIIFHEDKGFIAVEVKGGTIERRDNHWYSTNKHGELFTIKDPANQAKRSMRTICQVYKDRYGSFNGTYSKYSMDLHGHTVMDSSNLDNIESWLNTHFSAISAKRKGAVMLTKDNDNFLDMMKRDISVPLSIRKAIELQEESIKEANTVQDYLLDLFDDKNLIGFQGAAGTGKTWIAMKKARRLAGLGDRVLFLCYNRQINDLIKNNLGDVENITVSTFHAFSYNVIRQYLKKHMATDDCKQCFSSCIIDIVQSTVQEPDTIKPLNLDSTDSLINGALDKLSKIPKNTSCSDVVADYQAKLPGAISEIVSLLVPDNDDFFGDRIPLAVMAVFENDNTLLDDFMFDTLIIDEAQDFHKNWCECLKYLFNKNEDRVCYIFYDDNQTIFTNEPELPVAGLITSVGLEDHIFKLRGNLRNTSNIHDFAVSRSGKGQTSRSLDIPGLEPVELDIADDKEAALKTGEIIKELVEEHRVPRENIIVLSNRSFEKSVFANNKKVKGYTLVPTGDGAREKSVRFRTIQQFKGLEADVEILVVHRREIDKSERYNSDELMYVGYTRAKHLLYVLNVG